MEMIINNELLDNRKILCLLKNNPLSFRKLNNYYKDREDIIFYYIKEYPSIYKYTSDRFKNDKDLVLKAVSINGLVLEYIDLKNDIDVIKKALNNNIYAIRYADKNICCSSKEIILLALSNPISKYYITDISSELRRDINFIIECMCINPKYINFADDDIKDIIRIKYIKEYTDNYLYNRVIYNKKKNNNKQDIVIDREYEEFKIKEKEFINNINRYRLSNISHKDNDILYKRFYGDINYEVDLTIISITYTVTDFNNLYIVFLNSINNIYNNIVKDYCIHNNIIISNIINKINYNLLPNEFYNNIVSICNNYKDKEERLLSKLEDMKKVFLFMNNNYYLEKGIDNKILELKSINISNYEINDIDNIVNSFNIYLNQVLDISNRINLLWNRFYSIDKRLISKNKYNYLINSLSIDNLSDYFSNNSLDKYDLYIKFLEQDIDSLSINSSNDIELISNYYLNYVEYYCDNLYNLLNLNTNQYSRDILLSKLHWNFNTYYDKYIKYLSKGKLSNSDILDLQEGFDFNKKKKVNEEDIINSNSLYKNESKLLYFIYLRVIERYKDKLRDITLDSKYSNKLIKVLQNKYDYAYSVYLDACKGIIDFDVAINILDDYSFNDNNYIIDNVCVSLPLKKDHSIGYIYYNVSDLDKGNNTLMWLSYGNTMKSNKKDNLIPLEDFINDMYYVGKWYTSNLGLNHIIYMNSNYALVIQQDIFHNDFIKIVKSSEIDRMLDYSEDIVNEFISYSDKKVFVNDIYKKVDESFKNKDNPKKLIYVD